MRCNKCGKMTTHLLRVYLEANTGHGWTERYWCHYCATGIIRIEKEEQYQCDCHRADCLDCRRK